jgi:hypothetical protein
MQTLKCHFRLNAGRIADFLEVIYFLNLFYFSLFDPHALSLSLSLSLSLVHTYHMLAHMKYPLVYIVAMSQLPCLLFHGRQVEF